jgi:hypothetical protein
MLLAAAESKLWLQSRMTPELVRAWRDALRSGKPVLPTFRFKAMLRKDAGPTRIEIDGMSKPVDELSLHDIAKVHRRCIDLAAALEPILTVKAAEAKQDAAQQESGLSPGLQRLKELGVSYLVDEPDDSGGDDDDDDDD